MSEALEALHAWISAHPGWAQILLFLVALIDGVFVIGAFVPAGIVLFAVGALVALGTLELWPTVLIAAAGALLGDCLSFWFGRHYGERLFEWRAWRKYPELIANARRFFGRHGGKGVVIARFVGPLRALTPALAGAAGMSLPAFLLTDGLAAIAWGFAYIIPGVVFGASLGLAAEVAGRLAMLLLALVVLIWIGVWLTLFVMRQMQAHAGRWVGGLLDWSRRHRVLGLFGAALADPDYPEAPVLLLIALVLLLLGGLCLYLLAAPALHPYPLALDAGAFQTLRDLHVPWGLALAERLLQLGEWPVYGPVALAAFVSLVLAGKGRAAAHWVAAIGFGALLTLGLYAVPTLDPPYAYFGLPTPSGFNPRDLVLATITYSFLPALVASDRPAAQRALIYTSSSVLLLLIVLSRLYLGAQWYSLALFGLVIGLAWASLLALGYRRHRHESLRASVVLLPAMAVFMFAAGLRWSEQDRHARVPDLPVPLASVSGGAWLAAGSPTLPSNRQDMTGRPKQPLNVQWAGDLGAIAAQLSGAGWQDVTRVRGLNPLRWLTATAEIAELPVLPQVHDGSHQVLVMRLPIDADSQYLLRLWPSGYRLDDGAPLWVGSLARQEARNFYRLFRYPVAVDGALPSPLPGMGTPQGDGGTAVYRLRS